MTQPPYDIARSTWAQVRSADYQLAVLPWGATEAHNYHLPYGTDVYESEAIAAEAARIAWDQGVHAAVLPCVPFGVNTGQLDLKLTINMNPTTQFAVLRDVVESLVRQGFRKLVVLNGHGGNDFRQFLRELGAKYPILLVQLNWFQVFPQKDYFTHTGNHADEMETSLMLHVQPELVRPLSEAGDGAESRFRIPALREGWAWSERHWPSATADTGIGDPREATKEKGERFFNELSQKIASFLVDLGRADTAALYDPRDDSKG